jgi:hypothetical protein
MIAPPRGAQVPSPNLTAAMVKQQLNVQKSQNKITGYATKGGTANEEVFLLNLIWGLANGNQRWNTELHIIAPIGQPKKPGDPAPQGQVIVRISDKGFASAELIARGVPTVTTQTWRDALKADFKFHEVRDETANWKPDELNAVGQALAMLPG